MKSTRQSAKRRQNPIESSDEDAPLKKKSPEYQTLDLSEDSSSESDIESYLKAPSKLDLSSSFFNPVKIVEVDEKDPSNAIGHLSDSESSDEQCDENQYETGKDNEDVDEIANFSGISNFEHINAYNAKFEETKKFIEMYKAKKAEEEPDEMEVDDILEKEEKAFYNSLGSAEFETLSDDENKSDWEEVQVSDDKPLIRKEGVEITINLPSNVKKKKSLDLMAAIKRRINRVKKENQVFVHKVHFLCWIAHGLYINTILNNQTLLGMALSLLPSKHCYPSKRIDLCYLENIVQWYRKTMTNKNLKTEFNGPLSELLEAQMLKKETQNYKTYIYIFICILRSLGAKCRLILSLQIEPIRPLQSELCSLSNKNKGESEKIQPTDSNKTKSSTKAERTTKTKSVTFKVNSSKILNKSLNKSLKESDKKRQKHSKKDITSKKEETSSKCNKALKENTIGEKDKSAMSNEDKAQLKPKLSLGDKLKRPTVSEKVKAPLKDLKDGKEAVSNENKAQNSKTNKKPIKETKEFILAQPSSSYKTDETTIIKASSKTKGENNSKQKSSTERNVKKSLNNMNESIENNTSEDVSNRRMTRRSSKSPVYPETTNKENNGQTGKSKEKEHPKTKTARQKKSPIGKEPTILQYNKVTSAKNSSRRNSKSPIIEEAVHTQTTGRKITGKNPNILKGKGRRNSKSSVHDNIVEETVNKRVTGKDEITNIDANVVDDHNSISVRGEAVSEHSKKQDPGEEKPEQGDSATIDEKGDHSTSSIKNRLRRYSKSPTVENAIDNNPTEGEEEYKSRRQSKSPVSVSNNNFTSTKTTSRRNSTSKNNKNNSEQQKIVEKESFETLKNDSASILQNSEHIGDDVEDTSGTAKQRKKNVFKIKFPLKKGITNNTSTEENEEDDDEVLKPPRKEFVLPIIKQEPFTPKKRFRDSDDDFLGFSAEETKNLLIPQVDGGADTPPLRKNKLKPNLSNLKTSPLNKCPRNHPTRLKKVSTYAEADSEDDFAPPSSSMSKTNPLNRHYSKSSTSSQDSERSRFFGSSSSFKSKQLDVRNDIVSLVKGSLTQQRETYHQKLVKRKSSSRRNSSEDDSDYFPDKISHKKSDTDDIFKEKKVTKVKRRIPMKKDLIEIEKKKVQAKEEMKRTKGVNIWVEIFAEAEEKWISVDIIEGQVHCVKEIFARANHPVSYILGFDNDNHIKDITKRYCENWNTVTRKLRVDSKWLEKTLSSYRAPRNAREREEDEDLAQQQLDQPLPKTISEYKNHPLYVLKRHLLKFEALYPPDALTLGFIRNEPVYSRDCVYVLHSRDIWLKHAKVVKPGEQPYKIVKARPKYDKLSNTIITDQMLEIFGKWQIEDYVPPTAEDGVVPKNAYGNVDLFKPSMLPKGTAHLQLPGLNKVARKLNIDCPPAVTGFDFHSGFSHPVFDGFVVCEEFSEIVVAAWVEEQEEYERKEQDKIEKRIYDNWKKLIKGLLIRERLKRRYDFGNPSCSKDNKTENTGKSGKTKHD